MDLTGARKTFTITITKPDGTQAPYESLSGGEKVRVNISLNLGLFDLLSSSTTKFNILVMDEVFEGLDEPGMAVAYEILNDKSKDTCLYVISHKPMDLIGVSEIFFEKVNNNIIVT